MGTAVRPAKTSPGPWEAFADGDVFVDEVLAELEAMAKDGDRQILSGPKPSPAGAALRSAVKAMWCICFCWCGRPRRHRVSQNGAFGDHPRWRSRCAGAVSDEALATALARGGTMTAAAFG